MPEAAACSMIEPSADDLAAGLSMSIGLVLAGAGHTVKRAIGAAVAAKREIREPVAVYLRRDRLIAHVTFQDNGPDIVAPLDVWLFSR